MKKFFALASLATLMFSCAEIDNPTNEKFPINIAVNVQTRANDTSFESGDAVGIYVVNYNGSTAGTLAAEGNQADNAEFIYNGGGWNSDEPIYWKDKNTSADFYAYYPYSETVNIEAQPFAVQTDQSNEDNFWASDFLWGKSTKVAPTSCAVAIQTGHALSRIIVEVKPGNGFTTEAWAAATKSVKICSVKTDATINLATGVATATGDNGEITPLATSTNYKAMIIPQTVADDSKLIAVTVDGTEYVYRTGYTFKANTQHNFSIVVNKNEGSINVSIGEWNIDETVNQGTAVEETNTNNQIYYVSSKSKIEGNWTFDSFGANIISHDWTDKGGNGYDVINDGFIKFDSDVTTIGEGAFASMDIENIFSIYLPESVTTIGEGAFQDSSLCYIELGNNITSIGARAFDGTWLYDISPLPSSLKTIGEYAFNSVNFSTLNCKATTPPTLGNDALPYGITVYVPTASVDAYKNAEGWSNYTIEGKDF